MHDSAADLQNVERCLGAVFFDVSIVEGISEESSGDGPDLLPPVQLPPSTRFKFIENSASVAGGAVFAKNTECMALFGLEYEDLTEGRCDQDFITISSGKYFLLFSKLKDNTVGEGGYGRHIATPALGYNVTLYYEDGTNITLKQGDEHDLGKWESGDDLPVIEVILYDHYRQTPARSGYRGAKIVPGGMKEVQLPDYSSYVRVVLASPDGLLPNDLVGNLIPGKDNITVGPPMVTPGHYTATLNVPDLNEERVTLSVEIRRCVINEVPREDNRSCIECKSGSYNFDPETGTCTVCPDNADCSGKYVLPKSGNWNAFPCSHHVQRCLREDACPVDRTKIEEEVLDNDVNNDEATCDLTEDEIEAYEDAECGKEYRGALCGSCKEGYAKIGQSRCRRCQHWTMIALAILLAVVLLAYASWQQIGGSLENVKTRWMRRVDRLRTMQREVQVQEALSRVEQSQEDAEIAQKAKEKFVFVLQVISDASRHPHTFLSHTADSAQLHAVDVFGGIARTRLDQIHCPAPADMG